MEYRIKVSKDFSKKIDSIIEKEIARIEKRTGDKIPPKEKKKIKRRTLDMLDAQVKSYSANKLVPVEELKEIILTDYTVLDENTICLNFSTRKGIKIEVEFLEETINKWLVEDLKTASIYCILGML